MDNTTDRTMHRTDRASTGFVEFLNTLGPDERNELAAALREPNTFLAKDIFAVASEIIGRSAHAGEFFAEHA